MQKTLSILLLAVSTMLACKRSTATLIATANIVVKDSVQQLIKNTEKDLSRKGPLAWLDHFEDSADFFMASDGSIAFRNYHNAESFIRDTLAHNLQKVDLNLSKIRITAISSQYASIGAECHELLTITTDKVIPYDGYFTATAHKTAKGWKYLNMHWSAKLNK